MARPILPRPTRPATAPEAATDDELREYLQRRVGLSASGARQLVVLNHLVSVADRRRLREYFRQFA